MQARGAWSEIFKAIKEKHYVPRTLYLLRLSFKIEGRLRLSETSEN